MAAWILLANRRTGVALLLAALIVREDAEPDDEVVAAAVVRRTVVDRVEHLKNVLRPRLSERGQITSTQRSLTLRWIDLHRARTWLIITSASSGAVGLISSAALHPVPRVKGFTK